MPKATAKKTHALRFAYSTINWTTKPDMVATFKDIKKAGWHAVELFDHSLDWLGPPDYLRSILQGLTPGIFFGGIEVPVNPDTITMHKRRMDYAALFGAEQYGLVGGGRLRTRPPTADEYKNLAAGCEELAKYGADKGITLAYHPHVGCTIETEGEIDILLNETKKTMLCLDVSHIGLVGEDSVAHIRKYKSRIGYMHLKDWAAGKFVEIGKGTIGLDFGAILAELVAQKFPGWVVVEQSSSTVSPLESAKINAAHIKSLNHKLELPEGN